MPVSRLTRYALGALVLSACGSKPDPSPGATRQLSAATVATDPLVYKSRALSFRLQQALSRIDEPAPSLNRFKATACPDDQLAGRSMTERARTLVLSYADARYEAHSLLPLSLTKFLESQEAAQFDSFFEASGELAHTPLLTRLLKSEQHAKRAERKLVALEAKTFKGVFYITEFKKAHLIRKKGKLRREWTRGLLRAWLVIVDIDTSEPVCQVSVLVTNDVDEAPLGLRLKPETQRRLVRELGEQLRAEAMTALGTISKVLQLPEPTDQHDREGVSSRTGRPTGARLVSAAQPPGKQ